MLDFVSTCFCADSTVGAPMLAFALLSVAANKPNEDRFLIDTKQKIFGVFDGHGGRHCSQYVIEHIGEIYSKCNKTAGGGDGKAQIDGLEGMFFSSDSAGAKKSGKAKAALKSTFKEVDEMFFKELGDEHNVCGSCAVLCVVEDGCVWAANCGDSRAILVQRHERGAVHGVPLTTDLNSSCASEVEKVKKRSTDPDAVRYNERDLMRKSGAGSAAKRVAGSLMVTRALGDGYLKCKDLSMPPFKEHVPYITSTPKVTQLTAAHTQLLAAPTDFAQTWAARADFTQMLAAHTKFTQLLTIGKL